MRDVRIGIDVGGTFTDFALALPDGLQTLKLPTTPAAPEVAILDGVARLMRDNGISADRVESGGYGQSIELGTRHGSPVALFAMFDRTTVQAQGRQGGGAGAMGSLGLKSGAALQPKGFQLVGPNERLCFEVPGGAGFGDPAARDPRARAADIRAGLEPDGAAVVAPKPAP